MNDKFKEAAQEANELKKEPVYQFDAETGEYVDVHESIGDAAKSTGIHKGDLAACARGVLKTAGGYKWVKLSDYHPPKPYRYADN